MLTEKQIEDQQEFERKCISGGLEKIRLNTKKLEDQTYASATVYGSASITAILPTIIKAIDDKKEYSRKHAGRGVALFNQYLFPIDSEIIALITGKIIFDHVFSTRKVKHRVEHIITSISSSLEAECQLRYYEEQAPALFATLKKNYWHESKGTAFKRKSMQTTIHKCGITPWIGWSKSIKGKIGAWCIDVFCEETKWFERIVINEAKRKKLNLLIATPELIEHKETLTKVAETFSPLAKPMLIKPRNWHQLQDGGYLLNDLNKCHHFVRKTDHAYIQEEELPYEFINSLQSVKYKLNDFIVQVAEELEEREIEVGKFKPIVNHPIQPKPHEDASKEAWTEWKRAKTKAMNRQAAEVRKSCRTRMTMNVVREFKEKDFYIPFSFDYRGRAYPIPSILSIQDTDFGKSLILFSEGAKITPKGMEWIKFQLATTYGLSKSTMEERIAWVDDYENKALVERVWRDPIGNIADWENADEPWLFLAACNEWYELYYQHRFHTHLPVAVDATCSGLQILAGLAKDASTARMVNVIGSEKPQDAYATIASRSMEAIPDRLKPYWDRKVTKRCVMTIPYNAKPFSNRSYIRDAFKEKGVDVEKEELTQCVQAVRVAMNLVVPGAMDVMKWIEQEVTKAIKNGKEEIVWRSPSGFKVHQKLMKNSGKLIRIQTMLMGRCDICIGSASKVVDLKHHKNATAPNLIHSLDASLLHFAATKFKKPIATIHDSVLCLATDMCKLSTLVRETYMHLFAEHEPLRDFARSIGSESEPPIIGDLKPEAVIDSQYFFC